MSKKFNPGEQIKFSKEALVFEEGTNESYQVPAGAKGIIVEDQDSGEAGECRVEIEKEGKEKVIVKTNDSNLAS